MTELVAITDCQIPDRHDDGHKGTFGRVLVVAGSDGMSGAACLGGVAALRGGSGLVTVMVPKTIQAIVAGYEPGYMTAGYVTAADTPGGGASGADDVAASVADDQIFAGEISEVGHQAVRCLRSLAENQNVVAVGPGLGTDSVAQALVSVALHELPCPVILDADALNVCAEGNLLSNKEAGQSEVAGRIVTPHPGEFARLTGLTIAEVQADRAGLAKAFAKQHGLIVVLKGPQTIVTDGDRVYVNDTGNSGLATGGSGDVLTGLLAAIVGQVVVGQVGLVFDAACVAVWLHGVAGDSAAEAFSKEALIASDLPSHFGRAWRRLRSLAR